MSGIRLYYFTSAKHGLAALEKRRSRVSRIKELNDPFELSGVEVSLPNYRKAMRALIDSMHDKHGLICFSRNWKSPVQWAHYAEKHKGMCLGFDVVGAEQVRYISSRAVWPDDIDEGLTKALLFTKFAHWSYEDEYRIYAELNEHENGHFFAAFGSELKLASVIVGCKSDVSRSDVDTALGEAGKNVERFKSRAAFRSFKMIRNENEKLWK